MSELVPPLTVEIAGQAWSGWSSIVITLGLGAVAASIGIEGGALPARGIVGSEQVVVRLDGETAFVGHLDEASFEVQGTSTSFTATGRSLTADLVDSIIDPTGPVGEERDVDLIDLIERYIKAAGVSARVLSSVFGQRVPYFAPTPGESYWNAIERACRSAQVLAAPSLTGSMRLLKATSFKRAGTHLRESENLLSMQVSTDWSNRSHRYVVTGEGDESGADWDETLAISGFATDNAVRQSRTLALELEGRATPEECSRRAAWEATVRRAQGSAARIVVPGWSHSSEGDLWAPGLRVRATAPSIGISGAFITDEVQLRYSDEGVTTQLTLRAPDAYLPQPVLESAGEPSEEALGAWG